MLFGHQNDTTSTNPVPDVGASDDYLASIGGNLGDAAEPLSISGDSDSNGSTNEPEMVDTPSQSPFSGPAVDASTSTDTPDDNSPVAEPVTSAPTDDNNTVTGPISIASTDNGASADLMDLKQQALDHLTPLVDHLDQTPEEKFRTTMMMIQSTDNQTLLKEAFAAAKEIPEDKARAQALLDVINEINYFAQKDKGGVNPSE